MITIFTPTYNRENLIKNLYQSLRQQTNFNFEWIIVDDCSQDNTEQVVSEFEGERFPIRYYKNEENSGKYIAYNKAIEQAAGEYFICVDSDDILEHNAVSIMCDAIEVAAGTIGAIFPQVGNLKINNKGWNQMDGRLVDVIDAKELFNIKETAILFKTDALKQHKFPDTNYFFYNEKYCPETVLYNALITEGKLLAINKGFYRSEYQIDGLTNNVFKLWIENYHNVLLDLSIRYDIFKKYRLTERVMARSKCILNLNAVCIKAKENILRSTPSKLYSIVLMIPSLVILKMRYKDE